MKFEDEYDPWLLFGTNDPLIDDAGFALSDEDQALADSEFEVWCENLEGLDNDADIPL